jgi:hypothetical protein
MLEAREAGESPDLSYLDGEGDEHLKDIPALELWRQTFKREVKTSLVKIRYKYVVEIISAPPFSLGWTDCSKAIDCDTTEYTNEEEKKSYVSCHIYCKSCLNVCSHDSNLYFQGKIRSLRSA